MFPLYMFARYGIFRDVAEPLRWIGGARGDLKQFPQPVRAAIGYALLLAQKGDKHPAVKPLKGSGDAGVLE